MIGDERLYQEIGQAIFNASPDGAVKLIMRAVLDSDTEGLSGPFEFDYVNETGETKWFPMGSGINTSLVHELLVRLRQSYLDNGQPAWNRCEFILDVNTGKFEFNIDYEDGK